MKNIIVLILFSYSYFSYANCPRPIICNRACWDPNGQHPIDQTPTTTTPTHVIVHHTADGIVYPSTTDFKQRVQAYWDFHVNTRGWDDIGYNWLIDKNGVIYEGRGDDVLGAHFSCMSSNTMGIALIGDFTIETPTAAAINALQNFIASEATNRNIDISTTDYHPSSQLNLYTISGHRDGNSSTASNSCASGTTCPGPDLYNLLPSIRSAIGGFACYNGIAAPGNDDCTNAIALQTSQNCNYTNGTVNGATTDNNWNDASCDQFSGSSLAAGVFYKFTASNSSHSITVDPTGDLDAVLSLYGGSSCSSLNEIACEDTPGGSGAPTATTVNNLTIGATYWIRIYDYGSQPPTNGDFGICVTHVNSINTEDITLTNASVTPTSVNPGGNIDVSVNQNYSGNQTVANLPDIDIDYYLSSDCSISANDVLLGTNSSSIGSDNTSSTESNKLVIPNTTSPGIYQIIFVADSDGEINESNENNNITCVQINVTNPGSTEDVTVTNATVTPTTVKMGEHINVSANQNYSGNQTIADLPDIDLSYYLSTNCGISSDDILLGSSSSPIGSDNTTSFESSQLVIPNTVAGGMYYIIFSADSDAEVSESNENNNITCVQINVKLASSVSDFDFKKQIKVYPNLTSSIINISSTDHISINSLMVYDIRGRLWKELNGKNLNQINVHELPPGQYLLKIASDKNQQAVYKVIKK